MHATLIRPSPTIRVVRPRPMAATRLCCFPFAGGGGAAFAAWSGILPEWMEVWTACLPGREGRIGEPMPSSFIELADQMARALEPLAGPALILFGHSMGAVLAYEVVRRLAARGAPEPGYLMVSGHGPPWSPMDDPPSPALPDFEFAQQVHRRFGGIPPGLYAHPELFRRSMAVLRGDIRLLAEHRAGPLPRLSCPVLALGGRGDPVVGPRHLGAWRDATTGPFSVRTFPGGHFYMQPDPWDLMHAMATTLLPMSGGGID